MSLRPQVVDIPLGNLQENETKHSGPSGRLIRAVNCETVAFREGSPATGPQINTYRQRPGFQSLSLDMRDSVTGQPNADDLHTPRLLASVGDQLVTICHGKPMVRGEDCWVRHDKLVLTQQLTESVVHTSNVTIQAPDSAWMGDVECIVWAEYSGPLTAITTLRAGFRDASGAWLRQPFQLTNSDEGVSIFPRVVCDGAQFWVCYPTSNGTTLNVTTFDAHGIQIATATKALNWTVSPPFWDVVASQSTISSAVYDIVVAQPAGFTGGAGTVNVQLTAFQHGGTINQSSATVAVNCNGPVAFLTNPLANGSSYLAAAGGGTVPLNVYRIVNNAVTHSYTTSNSVDRTKIDAIAGGVNADLSIFVAASLRAPSAAAGPPFDPALRTVVSWKITSAGVATLIGQHNGVLLQSRAFKVDDDWFAVTYYQSGPGLSQNAGSSTIAFTAGDYFTGAPNQPLALTAGDLVNGSPRQVNSAATQLVYTQATFAITHNAGDSVVAATGLWTLLNAAFVDNALSISCVDSYLVVSGATPSSLNTRWKILSRPSATSIVTSNIGSNGTALADSSLVGATCSLDGSTVINIPIDSPPNGVAIESNVAAVFIGGTVVVAGALHAANNATYSIFEIDQSASMPGYSAPSPYTNVTKIVSNTFPFGNTREVVPSAATLTIDPAPADDRWFIQNARFTSVDVGATLHVEGAGAPGVGGDFLVSAASSTSVTTAGYTSIPPYAFSGSESLSIVPVTPFLFFLQAQSFDQSFIGSAISVSGGPSSLFGMAGAYTILSVVDSHHIIVVPATGATGQRNEPRTSDVVVTVVKANSAGLSLQPCWFITPISTAQQTVGRFEYGIAFADWRFDADAAPNAFVMAAASANVRPGVGTDVSLPYRAQSFTGSQKVAIGGVQGTLQGVLENTVGIKEFLLSVAPGLAVANGQTLLLPGPRASQFSLSGFGEQGVNLGFEKPYLVSQSTDASIVGVIPGVPYQVVYVAEFSDDNGDRVYSVPSLPLDFTLTGTNNRPVYGGRLIGPTDKLIAISIYRTATQSGVPTTQHYRITNPLDVNGTGFAFSTSGYNYTGAKDSFTFTDKISDATATQGEVLYTDKGFLPRYPMPAFSVATNWKNRVFAVGYDGAVWMSGEKTDGDALWFHPALRFVLPTANHPVSVAPMDNYLVILCGPGPQAYWFIPEANFPDATGQNGTLPNPVEVQFQGSCSGFSLGTKNGVVYSNTAGGLWLITRNLTNGWLSQPVQNDLTATSVLTGLSIDNNQRMYATDNAGNMFVWDQISGTWWTWRLPAPSSLLATWRGAPVYQDTVYVMPQVSTTRFDTRGAARTGCPPLYDLADLDFGTVRAFKCLWEMQLLGTYKGPHNLNVTLSYPDEISQVPTEFTWTPSPDDEYIYSFNPEVEQSSTYHVVISADFDGIASPADSFELEMLSSEVGIQPGLNRLPGSNQKIAK